MTFIDSIRTCFKKYADFTGCASVSEFWWWMLFTIIASIVAEIFSQKLSLAFSVLTFLPSFAVGARRLHDTNRSGWLQLLLLIPIIGWIVLIVFWVQDGKMPNRYCEVTQELAP
jgi:uncharacterized membrane protein YhaH (DUF805 family)